MKKKDVFVSAIKGIITGTSLWINNISIGSMLFSASCYDNVIDGLSNIRKKNNKELLYVCIPLIIGICFGLLAGFNLINYFLSKYRPQTIILFVGFFIGGIRVVYKKKKLKITRKNAFIPLVILTVSMILITLLKEQELFIKNNFVNSLVIALISGISLLIPSFSGFISNIKNGFSSILNTLKLSSFNDFLVLLIFILVFIIVIVLLAKLIRVLLNKNNNNTYLAICSLVLVNVVLLVLQIKTFNLNFVTIFTSILAFLWGYIFAKNVERE